MKHQYLNIFSAIENGNDELVSETTVSNSIEISTTERWVENVVIGLNLCPFAKREWSQSKVRIQLSQANSQEQLLQDLVVELALLNRRPDIETSLLVHPYVLQEFDEYNQFLAFADALITEMGLDGVYQIASFHPDYQFDGTARNDVENYTNRSPYPMLHLLREASLERAIEAHPDTVSIPQTNIQRLKQLGASYMHDLLNDCNEEY